MISKWLGNLIDWLWFRPSYNPAANAVPELSRKPLPSFRTTSFHQVSLYQEGQAPELISDTLKDDGVHVQQASWHG